MGEHRRAHGLHVLRGHVIATGDHRDGASGEQQRERTARRRPHQHVGVRTGGGSELDAVPADALVDICGLDRRLHREHRGGVGDPAELLGLLSAFDPTMEHLPLLVAGGVAEAGAQQEPVELRLRQGVGALVLDRVRGGEHVERWSERERLALHGDLALLHRLEQGGLCLRRRAVDLVGEQQPREQRAVTERELS